MKLYKLPGLLALVAAARVSAVPILVSEFQPANASPSIIHQAISSEIAGYNETNPVLNPLFASGSNPGLVNGWSVFLPKTNDTAAFGDHTLSYTAPLTFSEYYVFSKYGAGGADFDSALHHLLAGDILTYNPGGAGSPQGLSDVAIWARGPAPIPDSGATAALLCISMIVLVWYRRRLVR